MKKNTGIFCLLTYCIFFIFVSKVYAQAEIVYDPSTDPLIESNIPLIATQLSTLQTQMGYIYQQLDSLKKIGANQYQWSDVSGKINQLGNIIAQTNGLAYGASDVSAQFQHDFPGYKPPQNFTQQYQDNVNTTLNTLNGVLQSLGMSANDFRDEQIRIQKIQALADNPQGQTQAIQASAVISSEMLSQIQLLRQTVMAQTNAQTTYYAQQVQKQAAQAEQQHEIIQAGSTDVPAYGTSGHYLKIPDF